MHEALHGHADFAEGQHPSVRKHGPNLTFCCFRFRLKLLRTAAVEHHLVDAHVSYSSSAAAAAAAASLSVAAAAAYLSAAVAARCAAAAAPHSAAALYFAAAASQVAAYCNGRDAVSEYDVLLLQHVLWQRPDTAERIADWVLSQLSADDGTKQVWKCGGPRSGLEVGGVGAFRCRAGWMCVVVVVRARKGPK
eukprot:355501-Chlamydomonas_euryale.AAC.2